MNSPMRTIMTAVLAAALGWPVAGAWTQGMPGPLPSAAECRKAVTDLDAPPGSEAFTRAFMGPVVHWCGEAGAVALNSVLQKMPEIQGTLGAELVEIMQYPFLQVQHPLLLRTALAMVADRGAPPLARVFAMQVALAQMNYNIGLRPFFSELLARPVGPYCIPTIDYDGTWSYTAPMPPGFQDEIATTLRRVRDDPAEPQTVRDVAGCALRAAEPPFRRS